MERSLHNMRVDTTLGFEDDLNHDVAAEIKKYPYRNNSASSRLKVEERELKTLK